MDTRPMMVLSQMMPGMESLPAMLLLTVGGWVCGFASLALRPFPQAHSVGRWLGIVAMGIGVVAPLFFLVVVGRHLVPLGYLIMAAPLLFGAVALVVYPKPVAHARGFDVLPPNTGSSQGKEHGSGTE